MVSHWGMQSATFRLPCGRIRGQRLVIKYYVIKTELPYVDCLIHCHGYKHTARVQ